MNDGNMVETKKVINREQSFCETTDCNNCKYNNRCILPKSGKNKKLKILNLDLFRESWIDKIDKSSKSQILKDREYLKDEFEKLHGVIKDESVSIGLRKFLKGKRKMIEQILSYSKKRIGVINNVINRSSNKQFSQKFIEVAEEELSHDVFQKILGRSVVLSELDKESMNVISEFIGIINN